MEISLTGNQMLNVLEAVSQAGPVSAAEVARICGINRTVAHRLLSTLALRSYVRRSDSGYTLGPSVFRLAETVDVDIRAVAKPAMQSLSRQTGETVVIHGLDDLEAVVLDQALGERHLVRVAHQPGSRHPLWKGASGWSLLAFQDRKLIERVLRSNEDAAASRTRIEEVKRDGYAISHDELQLGVHGVAVPVLEANGRCRISLGILVPSVRAQGLETFVGPLIEAAGRIVENSAAAGSR